MNSVALVNNKGGPGKAMLTFHLAHMLQRMGRRVLAVDLDPQASLTAAFLDEDDLRIFWDQPQNAAGQEPKPSLPDMPHGTVASAIRPVVDGTGDIASFYPVRVADGLWLVPGDLGLCAYEERLAQAWPRALTGTDLAAVEVTSAFHRLIGYAAKSVDADLVLIDVGPNLGAINRAALLAADTVLTPLAPDLFSLRGLDQLGPALSQWRSAWRESVLPKAPVSSPVPHGLMAPLGYVVMQPENRSSKRLRATQRWLDQVPVTYATAVLGQESYDPSGRSFEIAALRDYQNLMPMAQDSRKPMFDLLPADGALGSIRAYVQKCREDFESLAEKVLSRLDEVDQPGGAAGE
ncbi:MAG TPA: ParA family protein [Streptosporangiaceae bacterium]|nr:ParA family protein [Streptosporangiaceae bacterium]